MSIYGVYGQKDLGAMEIVYVGHSLAQVQETIRFLVAQSDYDFVVTYKDYFRVDKRPTTTFLVNR